MWRAIPWTISAALALLSVWLIYGSIDQAVTLDHRSQQAQSDRQARDVILVVTQPSVLGLEKRVILERLNDHGVEHFDKGSDELVADGVVFVFVDDHLVRIEVD